MSSARMLYWLLVLKVFGEKENTVVNNKLLVLRLKHLREWTDVADEDKKTCWTIRLSTTGEFVRLDSFGCLLGFSCVLGKNNDSC